MEHSSRAHQVQLHTGARRAARGGRVDAPSGCFYFLKKTEAMSSVQVNFPVFIQHKDTVTP